MNKFTNDMMIINDIHEIPFTECTIYSLEDK